MRWYDGSIVEAVKLSKSKNAYFVVYIAGTDEKTTSLTNVLNQPEVSSRLEDADKFVAIKIASDSTECKQFADIYKFVPVPSLFFIGDNGAPVEIVHSLKDNLAEDLVKTIDTLISKKGSKSISADKASTSSFLSSERGNNEKKANPIESTSKEQPMETEEYKIVCENGVCRKVKVDNATTKADENSSDIPNKPEEETKPSLSIDEKVERAKELLEKKRKEKIEEEKKKEKEKEIERRAQGHGMAELKRWQHEQELKNLKEERIKEKKENEIARAKILQQIAQDRAEKQARYSAPPPEDPKPGTSQAQPKASTSSENVSKITRIQFKMPDGTSHNSQFDPASTLKDLRQYARQNIMLTGAFTLSTMYPRQILDETKDPDTLQSLGLHPSAVLLLIKGSHSSNTGGNPAPIANFGFFGVMQQFLYSFLVQPAFTLWSWIYSFINPTAGNNQNNQPDRPSRTSSTEESRSEVIQSDASEAKRRRGNPSGSGTTFIRKEGNTYRLKDNDSDDENNTWNGNSTQQM